MKKGILVLVGLMVILAGFVFVMAEGVNETNETQTKSCIPAVFIHPEIIPGLDMGGSVYVGVGIRDPSGIIIDEYAPIEERLKIVNQIEEYKKNISEEIRNNLTIDEFNITRVSIDGTVFFGYITKKGLEKLNGNCYIENIVIPLNGTTADNPKNQFLPYVDPAILTAFENQTWVDIMVRLKNIEDIIVTRKDTEEQQTAKKLAQKEIFDQSIDSILSNLTEIEFKLEGRFVSGRQFYGKITKEGFNKISKNIGIAEIYLPAPPLHIAIPSARYDRNMSENISNTENPIQNNTAQNQTEIKPPETTKPQSFFQKIISFFKRLFGRK